MYLIHTLSIELDINANRCDLVVTATLYDNSLLTFKNCKRSLTKDLAVINSVNCGAIYGLPDYFG